MLFCESCFDPLSSISFMTAFAWASEQPFPIWKGDKGESLPASLAASAFIASVIWGKSQCHSTSQCDTCIITHFVSCLQTSCMNLCLWLCYFLFGWAAAPLMAPYLHVLLQMLLYWVCVANIGSGGIQEWFLWETTESFPFVQQTFCSAPRWTCQWPVLRASAMVVAPLGWQV